MLCKFNAIGYDSNWGDLRHRYCFCRRLTLQIVRLPNCLPTFLHSGTLATPLNRNPVARLLPSIRIAHFNPLTTIQTPRGVMCSWRGPWWDRYTHLQRFTPQQLMFIDTVLDRLADFREGKLILGGDFNVSLDPSLDTLASRSTHPYAFLGYFRRSL